MTGSIDLSAAAVLDAFRSGQLSPVAYLEELIDRAEAMQPIVNAFGDTYFDEALVQAARAEASYLGKGEPPRPLEGLPVAVKDEASMAGKRTTNGSLLWADAVAEESEPLVERLQQAGAIIHARTLTPEFSAVFWTQTRMWGITRNPWNTEFDVGGSSGGSAAALAAGMTPLATGSDIGGSVRVPASCCGVLGYKPTYGRIPQRPPFGLDAWSHLGPLARTVEDLALAADTLIGPHPADHVSLRPAVKIGRPAGDVRGLRIALSADLGDWPVTDPVRAAAHTLADVLRGEGATVEEVELSIERDLVRTASDAHHKHRYAAAIASYVGDRWDEVNPYITTWLSSLGDAPSALVGLEAEGVIDGRIGAVLDAYDALLCPAIAIPAFRAGVDYSQVPVVIDGREYDALHDICPTEVFNVASRCPVITVPAGRDEQGVPIGIQVVGRTYDDPMVFRIAAAVERGQPWPTVAQL